jgi:hypothetical protein
MLVASFSIKAQASHDDLRRITSGQRKEPTPFETLVLDCFLTAYKTTAAIVPKINSGML